MRIFWNPTRAPVPGSLATAAREVIAAADNTYGPNWRAWHKPAGAGPGGQRLSRALGDLERSLAALEATTGREKA